MVGGNWCHPGSYGTAAAGPVFNASSVGTYTLGSTNGTGSPLLVGGCEVIGVSGTGTFTQNCGTNAIVGGGTQANGLGHGDEAVSPITPQPGHSCSAGIGGDKRTQPAI